MATLSGYCTFKEASGFLYSVQFSGSVTTGPKTLIQITAGSADPLEVVEAAVGGQSDTADAMEILIARKSGAATSGTSFTPLELNEDGPAANTSNGTGATGVLFTSEGTTTDILVRQDVSVQAGGGFYWSAAIAGTRIWVPASGIISVISNITIT